MLAAEGIYDVTIDWPTFMGQLIGFAVIVYVIVRYVTPPVRSMMTKQQDTVRRQLAESEAAKARLAEARQAYEHAVNEAQQEASKIREDARADAQVIADQLRAQANAEVARVEQRGREQIALARAQLIRQLEADLGAATVDRAARGVREHLGSPQAKSDSVDRFLDELEAMAASAGTRRREF